MTWHPRTAGNAHFLRVGHVLINVHRWHGKGGWWLSCVEAGAISESLGTDDLRLAKAVAVMIVRQRLENALEKLKSEGGGA
jgi:hypothetical protein